MQTPEDRQLDIIVTCLAVALLAFGFGWTLIRYFGLTIPPGLSTSQTMYAVACRAPVLAFAAGWLLGKKQVESWACKHPNLGWIVAFVLGHCLWPNP